MEVARPVLKLKKADTDRHYPLKAACDRQSVYLYGNNHLRLRGSTNVIIEERIFNLN